MVTHGKLAALASGWAAALAVAGFAYLNNGESPGSSASRTAYSFAYALSHHNFGRACSYIAQEQRGAADDCSAGFTYNAGVPMMIAGVDIFAGMHVVGGSAVQNGDGSVTYKVGSDEIPESSITVAKQDGGVWRVAKIG